MPQRHHPIQRLEELKLLCAYERSCVLENALILEPVVKKVASTGAFLITLKKLAPAAKPIAFGLIQRSLARRGKTGWLKAVSMLSLVIGGTRTLSKRLK